MAELISALISIGISSGLIIITERIVHTRLKGKRGTRRVFLLISLAIVTIEATYLSLSFALFDYALEIITSIGVGMIVIGLAFQSFFKNLVGGFSILLNSDYLIDSKIEVKDILGTVTEIYLTKTVIRTEQGETIIIPNGYILENPVKIIKK